MPRDVEFVDELPRNPTGKVLKRQLRERRDGSRVLAVDVGGTKLSAGIVTGAGVLVERRDAPTPRTTTRTALFAALAALVGAVDGAAGRSVACGVGCGGPMDRGRRARLAGEHPRVARVPAAGAARRA